MAFLVTLPDKVEPVTVDLPCLILYETCHAIYNQGPEMFRKSMLGDFGDAGCVCFWKHAMTEEWAQKHPIVEIFKDC